jgi:hypothetical protein
MVPVAAGEPIRRCSAFHQPTFADLLGIMRQVQPGPEPNLQNVAVSVGQQVSAIFGDERLTHHEIADAWENDLRIKAHDRSSSEP